MYRTTTTSLITFSIVLLSTQHVVADHGFDRLIANNTGRCWRVINRDFSVKGNAHSAIFFKFTSVAGTGQTDDQINYELIIKENYVDGFGWDEFKTQTYTGTGLVKTIENGRVNFEFYLDLGNGNAPIDVQAYYHPGSTTADADDRLVVGLPAVLGPPIVEDPCANLLAEEGFGL